MAALLALSDERDTWLRRVLAAWRDGYAAATADRADDYSRGYANGVLARKHAQHDLAEAARVYAARWGSGGRGHFADPRPGDYPARRRAAS